MTGPGSSDEGEAETAPPMGQAAPTENNVVRVDFGRAPVGAKGKGAQKARQTARDGISRETLDAEPQAKLEAFTRLVGEGMVLVTLDARAAGVSVPPRFRGDFQLALNFSVRFQRPDFVFDSAGVRATLTFQHEPFFCDVPWEAVYMLRSHVTNELVLFPGSLPSEFLETLPPAARARIEAARGQLPSPAAGRAKPVGREETQQPEPGTAADVDASTGATAAPQAPIHDVDSGPSADAPAPAAPTAADTPASEARPRPMLRLVKSEPPRRS